MIYIDSIHQYPTHLRNKSWCHMMVGADDDLAELHAMADELGLKQLWFQDKPGFPHYDLTPTKRTLAIKLGAIPVDSTELVRKCKRPFRDKVRP